MPCLPLCVHTLNISYIRFVYTTDIVSCAYPYVFDDFGGYHFVF